MISPFTQMMRGEIACHKILESDLFLAVMEPRPIRPGHVIVFPKKEIDAVFGMPDELLAAMMIFCKQAAQKMERAVPCVKVGIMAAGLKVRHAHIHLIPIQDVSDLDFSKQKSVPDSELAETARRIREQL